MDYFTDGYGMHAMGGGYGASVWGWLCMLLVVVLVVLVVLAAVWLVRSFANNKTGSSKNNALDIAKQRYAKGEITKEQFNEMKQDLK